MEDIKIGILTLHAADNYGAVLQAYALQHYIEENISKNVEIIDYQYNNFEKNPFRIVKRTHNIFKNIILWLIYLLNYPKLINKHRKFEIFRKNYLHLTQKKYIGKHHLKKLNIKIFTLLEVTRYLIQINQITIFII